MKKLKWFKQEKSYSCGAACLRMVLNYYGIKVSEQELRKISKTKPDIGVHPISLLEAAKSLELNVRLNQLSFQELQSIVNKENPVIAFIVKITEDYFYHHTVVVESISKNQVILLDPEEGRIKTDTKNFELAWSAAGNLAIIIQTKKVE